MLNIFAATGHNNYAKCGRLVLQMMRDLLNTHPRLYMQFAEIGYYTVRRTDRYWAGLSTDLVIEQTLMRSLKSHGGLTHGSGMTENVRTTWVLNMHKFADIHQAMVQLTNIDKQKHDQHVDMSNSRVLRDHTETCTKLFLGFSWRTTSIFIFWYHDGTKGRYKL